MVDGFDLGKKPGSAILRARRAPLIGPRPARCHPLGFFDDRAGVLSDEGPSAEKADAEAKPHFAA